MGKLADIDLSNVFLEFDGSDSPTLAVRSATAADEPNGEPDLHHHGAGTVALPAWLAAGAAGGR